MDKLVSGWSWNGITTFQTGYPLPIVAQPTVLSSSFGAGTPRPNVVPGCTKRITGSAQSRLAHWFYIACFTQPSAYGFGNETRTDSTVRTAGIANWDTALMKTITLRESLNLQFTTEVFNLFNRVQFGIPNNVTGSGNFGVVSSQLNQPRLIQIHCGWAFDHGSIDREKSKRTTDRRGAKNRLCASLGEQNLAAQDLSALPAKKNYTQQRLSSGRPHWRQR